MWIYCLNLRVWVAAHRDTKQKLYYYEKTSNQKINHRKKFAKKMEKSGNFENEEFGVILDPREQRRRLSLAIKERLENLTVKSDHQKGIFWPQFVQEGHTRAWAKALSL